MLDRNSLILLLDDLSDKIFSKQDDNQPDLALRVWRKISTDPDFVSRVKEGKSSFLIPSWQEDLSTIVSEPNSVHEYTVLGVDGSQIYPDNHMSGVDCFVINTGACLLSYEQKSSVSLFSVPKVFLSDQITLDLVDLQRESLEFSTAFEYSLKEINIKKKNKESKKPFVFLFDGSLIFWHLEGKSPEIRDQFLKVYLDALQKFYDNSIFMAGYISMPKSRELVNLVRLGLCRFDQANCIACHHAFKNKNDRPCYSVDRVIDSQLCSLLLKSGERTIIFYSTSKITSNYPEHLRPAFFYINVESEIVRVEIPAWVAGDPSAVDVICAVVLDQVKKGLGYPVALAEAHEQAVIRSSDRDFFYNFINRRSIKHNRRVLMSPKSIKKRGLGI